MPGEAEIETPDDNRSAWDERKDEADDAYHDQSRAEHDPDELDGGEHALRLIPTRAEASRGGLSPKGWP